MSEASKSQIVFARTIVRYALYQSVFNVVPVVWAIWAFVIGIPDALYWPSFWIALSFYAGGSIYLLATMLIPAIRRRVKDRQLERP
jgi:zinc transporter ZupT